MKLEAGFAVNPNVTLVRELGAGGMGSVWVAHHETLHTDVAVKFILDARAGETALKRFSREASLAAQIKSPHVVQTFDHGATEDGLPYIVMELLEGLTLDELLEQNARLSLKEVSLLVSQVSKALTRAHDLGIAHRDLKPANLFLTDSEYEIFVKVLDFGIAKRTKKLGDEETALTDSYSAVGTPYYMSPEALRAKPDLDHRTDLWSLAVVAYHALTGQLPFCADTFGDQIMLVHEGKFVPPTEYIEDVPELVNDWFQTAFKRDVNDRFQTARDMAIALRMALGPRGSESGDEFPAATSYEPSALSLVRKSRDEAALSTDETVELDTGENAMDEERGPDSALDETATATGHQVTPWPEDADAPPASEPSPPSGSVAARTLGTTPETFEGAATSRRNTVPTTKSRGMIYALGAVGLVAVLAFVVTRGGSDGAAETRSATPTPSAEDTVAPTATEIAAPEPTASASASAEAAHGPVSLTIDSVPARVEVLEGTKVLGRAPGPLELEHGTGEIELTFRAPGYTPQTKKVTPDGDKTVSVKLTPQPRAQPKAQPQITEW